MDEEAGTFEVEMHSTPAEVLVVTLQGALDLAQADWVEDTLAAAASHHRRMEIRLSKVTFLDSTGIRTLLTLRDRARALGLDLHFRDPSPAVDLALRAAGLTNVVDPG